MIMRNLTIHLDEETHRRAKIYAAETGVSLSKLFRELIAEKSAARGRGKGVLERYATMQISASEVMAALDFPCLEDLYYACIEAGLAPPHIDPKTAFALAEPAVKLLMATPNHA